MKKSTIHRSKNELSRCIIFLIIIMGILYYLTQAFTLPDSDDSKQVLNAFYEEKEDTLDGIYIGASSAYRYWIPPLAYEQNGFAIASMCTNGQPLTFAKYLMEEAMKTQNPNLFIIELRAASSDASQVSDVSIRRVTDSMKSSITRIKAINSSLNYAYHGNNDVSERVEYYFPIIKYHDRWKENITKEDLMLAKTENQYKGFVINSLSFEQEPQRLSEFTNERMQLDKYTEEVLLDLLDYCDSLNRQVQVLFVFSPLATDREQLGKINTAFDIVEAKGYTAINFNTTQMIEDVGVNFNTDFYDSKHTNYIGAERYTKYLANYIKEHYALTDHRADPDYVSWDNAYQNYVESIERGKEIY